MLELLIDSGISEPSFRRFMFSRCRKNDSFCRKQAKTRAVKLVKEAIENPALGVSSALLRGHMGACRPATVLDPFLHARCVNLPADFEFSSAPDADDDKKCYIFEARQKKSSSPQLASSNPSQEKPVSPLLKGIDIQPNPICAPNGKRSYEECMQLSSYFPVTLYITAVGEGALAPDISDKARERLESILTKIPKEQQTSIECGGGLVPLKLRGNFYVLFDCSSDCSSAAI